MTFLELRNHVASLAAEVRKEEPLLGMLADSLLENFDQLPAEQRPLAAAEADRYGPLPAFFLFIFRPILVTAATLPDPVRHPGVREAIERVIAKLPQLIERALA